MTKPEKWILLGIPLLFLIGGGWHFVFDFIPIIPIAIMAPVNDSVWEHMKMGLWPVIGWWSIYYLIKRKQHNINPQAWFMAALSSLIVTLITLPLVFYFYRFAFGIPMGTPYQSAGTFALFFDMFILLLANTLGQLLGLHLYKRYKGIKITLTIIIIIFIVIVFAIFTFRQPQIPLFFDYLNNHYGMP
ncbi:MAG: DUF6512 family protein [Defluviitaleaceae bacterium]|nr:DUF6512 family protein [Defluviitaleaceae bacterium]